MKARAAIGVVEGRHPILSPITAGLTFSDRSMTFDGGTIMFPTRRPSGASDLDLRLSARTLRESQRRMHHGGSAGGRWLARGQWRNRRPAPRGKA